MIPSVADGDDLTETFTLNTKAVGDELTAAVGVVRRRDVRGDQAYASGQQTLNPGLGSNVENIGGITLTGNNTYTVPVAGTYALTLILNPTAAWGSGVLGGATIVRSGVTSLLSNALLDTSIAVATSWTVHLNASDTVVFNFTTGAGATVAIECQVALVSPPPAP